MKIKSDSLRNISENFYSLADNMGKTNYCVILTAKTFSFFNNEINFFLTDLQKIFYQETKEYKQEVQGYIEEKRFQNIKDQLNIYLKTTAPDDSAGYDDFTNNIITGVSVKQPTYQWRKDAFWSIIDANFTMPPTHCFEHKPEHDSFFGGGIMWEFCYILLNDTTKQGIVIAGQAYD